GFVRSNFCFDMFAISFVSPLSLWPVDWRPPATEMRQDFLGLASLADHGSGVRVNGNTSAMSGRAGRSHVSNADDSHVQQIKTTRWQKRKSPLRRDRRGLWMFLQPCMALKR